MPSSPVLHDNAVLALLGLPSLLTFLDFCNHAFEGLADILVEPSTCFCPSTAEFLGQFAPVFGLDLTLLRSQVRFVTNNDQRD